MVAYIRLSEGITSGPGLEAELREHVAVRTGELAWLKQVIWAEDLPETLGNRQPPPDGEGGSEPRRLDQSIHARLEAWVG